MTTATKYCVACGKLIQISAIFCEKCGGRQEAQQDGPSDKSFVATILLCIFFGPLGIHRFYVGKIFTGVLTIFTIFGFFGIWAMIDTIMIVTGNFKDSDGRKIKP